MLVCVRTVIFIRNLVLLESPLLHLVDMEVLLRINDASLRVEQAAEHGVRPLVAVSDL